MKGWCLESKGQPEQDSAPEALGPGLLVLGTGKLIPSPDSARLLLPSPELYSARTVKRLDQLRPPGRVARNLGSAAEITRS